MKAVSRIQANINGETYDIPAGREVPPELAAFLVENKAGGLLKEDKPADVAKKKD